MLFTYGEVSLVPSLFQDMGDEEESGERASHYLEHWNVIGVTCGVAIERNCVKLMCKFFLLIHH